MHNFKDKRGGIWVACSECERGGNGSDPDKCSSGWKVKRFNKSGCFSGALMEKYKQKPVTQNESGSGYCVLSTDAGRTRLEAAKREVVAAAAQEVLTSVDELIANSQGVYGLHLNGDLAPWSDLLAGGRFGEWLEPLEKLRAALKDGERE